MRKPLHWENETETERTAHSLIPAFRQKRHIHIIQPRVARVNEHAKGLALDKFTGVDKPHAEGNSELMSSIKGLAENNGKIATEIEATIRESFKLDDIADAIKRVATEIKREIEKFKVIQNRWW